MSSAAALAKGYTLKDASNNAIAEITSLGEFGGARADVKVTSTDSAGNYEEYIAGMIEGGEFTATCNFVRTDTTGQIQAITDCLAGTRQVYTITMSQGSIFSALMHVKSYKISNTPLTDAIKITLVFKVDGAPTFTP
jgi:predicted secreted protein